MFSKNTVSVASATHSMPWMLKIILLFVNVYFQFEASRARARSEASGTVHARDHFQDSKYGTANMQRMILILVIAEFISMLSSVLPSLVFSVQDRRETTTLIVFQTFFHLNIFILSCVVMREQSIAHLLHVALQFMYVHYHYWQAKILYKKHKIFLFSGVFAFLHTLCVLLVPVMLLMTVRTQVSRTSTSHQEHAQVFGWMLILFMGEIACTVAYVESYVLKMCGQKYEDLFSF